MRVLMTYAFAGVAGCLTAAPAFALPSIATTLAQCLQTQPNVERVHEGITELGWLPVDEFSKGGTRNTDGVFLPSADFESSFLPHYHAFWFRLHASWEVTDGLGAVLERSYDMHPEAGYFVPFQSDGLRNVYFSDAEMTFALYVLSHAERSGKHGHGCLVVGPTTEEDLEPVFAGQRETEMDANPYQIEKRFFSDAGQITVSGEDIFARWGGAYIHWDSATLAEETQNRVKLGLSANAHVTWETPVE